MAERENESTIQGASDSTAAAEAVEQLADEFDEFDFFDKQDPHYQAAKAIHNADFLLVAAGAGFSADSGLAVYKDVAKCDAYAKMNLTYMDVCDPDWLKKNPEIFWGFWGKCYNDYKNTPCHKGYEIVLNWSKKLFGDKTFAYKGDGHEFDESFHSSYVYTSNVDSFFIKSGWSPDLVKEIHGSAMHFQCAEPSRCRRKSWALPAQFNFDLDLETMKAKDKVIIPKGEYGVSEVRNHIQCIYCGKQGRPNVLMFGDMGYCTDDERKPKFNYYAWRGKVESLLKRRPNSKLVILEMGCGKNVPTVRYNSQNYFSSELAEGSEVTLVRINPDFPGLDHGLKSTDRYRHIGIQSRALPALELIDRSLGKFKA